MSPWFLEAFPLIPYEKSPPGEKEMLTLLAYDITSPRRLSRVARVCGDFGVRVQYSIFECHLEEPEFSRFWEQLLSEIDPAEDRLVAYQLDAKCAKRTLTAGRMVCTDKVICYLV